MSYKLHGMLAAALAGSVMMGFGTQSSADTTSDLVQALVAKGVLTEEEGALLMKGHGGEVASNKKKEPKKGYAPASVSYGKSGFEFGTEDDKFSLAIQNRIQFRYAEPFDKDPRTTKDLDADTNSFMIRRARTKLKGHAFVPWIKYYMQYDWSQPVLRDLSLTVDKYKWAQLRVGRGKVSYNNERVASSGAQQFVNRSIVNDIFTVDRQQGVELKGNLFAGTPVDMTYYVGAFTGVGVGERDNDDDNMMYSGRLQWNAMGGEMKWDQSDTDFSEEPHLNISIAANTNQSKCTAFETANDGCRVLKDSRYKDPNDKDSAKRPAPGQYKIDQMLGEVSFKYKGFSFLHELHSKKIKDTLNFDEEVKLLGGFVQAGYFPHGIISGIPKELEIAARYAVVDMDTDRDNDKQKELSAVVNYFFDGHNNKISLQASRLTVEDPATTTTSKKRDDETRLWAQWDLSF
ncbi:MAG: hypothetical protein FJY53_01870 [Betaproteobacteria bacterium]|nr:hypothetical protein [Betaproteobacteria bacterium]